MPKLKPDTMALVNEMRATAEHMQARAARVALVRPHSTDILEWRLAADLVRKLVDSMNAGDHGLVGGPLDNEVEFPVDRRTEKAPTPTCTAAPRSWVAAPSVSRCRSTSSSSPRTSTPRTTTRPLRLHLTTCPERQTTMDPQACLQRLLDLDLENMLAELAVDGGELYEVEAASTDLLRWLAHGGARPTVSVDDAEHLSALTVQLDQLGEEWPEVPNDDAPHEQQLTHPGQPGDSEYTPYGVHNNLINILERCGYKPAE